MKRTMREAELSQFRISQTALINYRVVGISFHRSPVELREQVSVPAPDLPRALSFLQAQPGIDECMVLSTCNRTELYLFNVDDLEGVVQANRQAREQCAREAEVLVGRAFAAFVRESRKSQVSPSIAAIRNQVHAICRRELERVEQKMPDLSDEHRAELERMLHRIAQKIVHPAIMELKDAQGRESTEERRDFIERIFGLEKDSEPVLARLG